MFYCKGIPDGDYDIRSSIHLRVKNVRLILTREYVLSFNRLLGFWKPMDIFRQYAQYIGESFRLQNS